MITGPEVALGPGLPVQPGASKGVKNQGNAGQVDWRASSDMEGAAAVRAAKPVARMVLVYILTESAW